MVFLILLTFICSNINDPPSSLTNESINGIKYNGIKANNPNNDNLVHNREPSSTPIKLIINPMGYTKNIIASTVQSNQLVTI